ncbi:MAG: gamma-glutamylcyclotransferase family protein [Myxococcota bacterium]
MTDVFVYGTLMRGFPQGAMLKRFPHVAATTAGRIYRLPAGYPALRVGADGTVHGELVRGVDDRVLRLLDQYEGVDEGLYTREPIEVVSGLRQFAAEAWVMSDPEARGGVWIPTGRWSGAIRR